MINYLHNECKIMANFLSKYLELLKMIDSAIKINNNDATPMCMTDMIDGCKSILESINNFNFNCDDDVKLYDKDYLETMLYICSKIVYGYDT